jgi:hypothetical protein
MKRLLSGQTTAVSNILFYKGFNVVDDTFILMVVDIINKEAAGSDDYQNTGDYQNYHPGYSWPSP